MTQIVLWKFVATFAQQKQQFSPHQSEPPHATLLPSLPDNNQIKPPLSERIQRRVRLLFSTFSLRKECEVYSAIIFVFMYVYTSSNV